MNKHNYHKKNNKTYNSLKREFPKFLNEFWDWEEFDYNDPDYFQRITLTMNQDDTFDAYVVHSPDYPFLQDVPFSKSKNICKFFNAQNIVCPLSWKKSYSIMDAYTIINDVKNISQDVINKTLSTANWVFLVHDNNFKNIWLIKDFEEDFKSYNN